MTDLWVHRHKARFKEEVQGEAGMEREKEWEVGKEKKSEIAREQGVVWGEEGLSGKVVCRKGGEGRES